MAEQNATETRSPLMVELGEFLPEMDLLQDETKAKAESSAEVVAEAATEETETAETVADVVTEEVVEEEQEEEAKQKERQEWPESAKRRVDKITAKLREAEEALEAKDAEAKAEVERLRQELEKTPKTDGPEPAARNAGPLDEVWSEKDLLEKADSALNWKRWAIENPDGGTLKVGDSEKEFTAEEVQRIQMNADRLLSVQIPKRREFLSKAASVEGKLRQDFPEMFDEKSEGWQGMMEALATVPELKTRPDGLGVALMMSLGLKEMQRLRAGKTEKKQSVQTMTKAGPASAGAAAKKLAPKPVEPAGGPTGPVKKPDNKGASLEALIESGGDPEAMTRYFTGG
jgi:hypothetical protein